MKNEEVIKTRKTGSVCPQQEGQEKLQVSMVKKDIKVKEEGKLTCRVCTMKPVDPDHILHDTSFESWSL
jgi:hypothetical protein